VDAFRSFLQQMARRKTIPPTVVGGWFQILSTADGKTQNNPTNGRWWMVQILSTADGKTQNNPTNGSLVDGSDPFWLTRIVTWKLSERI
jgi:hypothetical protein